MRNGSGFERAREASQRLRQDAVFSGVHQQAMIKNSLSHLRARRSKPVQARVSGEGNRRSATKESPSRNQPHHNLPAIKRSMAAAVS